MTGDYVIDIDELAKRISNYQGETRRRSGLSSIRRIQPIMHDEDDKVYEPNMVSIGPYHYMSASTISMQNTKWGYLEYILSLNPEKKLSDYIEAMRGLEKQMRSCYAEEINMDRYEFLKMMLLDGCFLLVTLHGTEQILPVEENKMNTDENKDELIKVEIAQTNNVNGNNEGFEHGGEYHYDIRQLYDGFITRDILLLENQIPLFVVTKIYELVMGENNASLAIENIVDSIEIMIDGYSKGINKFYRPKEFHHLLHLCHMYFRPISETQVRSNLINPKPQLFPSFHHLRSTFFKKISSFDYAGWHRAVEYHKAGMKFKKREVCSKNPHSLLDIAFCDGEIEIPRLIIDPNTYCLFRNFVAFQQTCPELGNNFTTYVVFLSQFISMPDDVSLLAKKGIIVHQLNTDAEVSDIFAALSKNVFFDFNGSYYLRPLYHAMQVHYEGQRPITSKIHEWALSLVP